MCVGGGAVHNAMVTKKHVYISIFPMLYESGWIYGIKASSDCEVYGGREY